jgi:hypothetical protein
MEPRPLGLCPSLLEGGVPSLHLVRPLAFLPLLAIAWSCLGPEVDPVARVAPHSRFKYEIELHARINVYGGPCNPTCFPTRIDDSHWLYVNRLEGVVPADELLLTYERGKLDFPQSALQGTVTFSGNRMTVELRTPHYNRNTVEHYHTYSYNGSFELRSRTNP